MVHVLTETNRHAGHADILHEQLYDAAGSAEPDKIDGWAPYRARIEEAARHASADV